MRSSVSLSLISFALMPNKLQLQNTKLQASTAILFLHFQQNSHNHSLFYILMTLFYMRGYAHSPTRTHICTHICTHTHTHTRAHTCTQINTHQSANTRTLCASLVFSISLFWSYYTSFCYFVLPCFIASCLSSFHAFQSPRSF